MIFYCVIDEEIYSARGRIHEAEHETAMRLLAYAAEKEYGIYPLPEIVTGERGKPYFRDCGICFSISHAKGLAVCGVSEKSIGVDCEMRDRYSLSAAKKVFSAAELEALTALPENDRPRFFTDIWTAKEACGKACGDGIFSPFREMTLTDAERAGDYFLKRYKVSGNGRDYIIAAAAEEPDDISSAPFKVCF